MPGTISASQVPSVSQSFANNFWGKEDAGVSPLLERMHNAKVTADELKVFYSARASIEEDYARKLLGLARKPLGSSEVGTLRMSLDVVRGEIDSIGKAHQNIASQMKTELDEQLSAHAGGMKERRKIVQNGIEKLLKIKTQQTAAVNKTRDRYEQDCLKIKGYLAQGHMVMGQEERKNKAKLEKTQIQLSSTSNEYQAAVKILEETTGRWNREWKVACDKFQDLEEERLDFMKSSLWSFANIASTVCVSDDASCEKVRLSLEDCDVAKDISTFIRECGTGQEIPYPPKFIDFCRGDVNDTASEASNEDNYSVAQFQRPINPAIRSSSPQPPVASESVQSNPLIQSGNAGFEPRDSPDVTPRRPQGSHHDDGDYHRPTSAVSHGKPIPCEGEMPQVPHNEYPMDGMTQFCRLGPPSERSSVASPNRPRSRDSQSEYSNPTSFSSQEPSLLSQSPTKMTRDTEMIPEYRDEAKRKGGSFFQNRSPFRRKSKSEKNVSGGISQAGNRNTWAPSSSSPRAVPNPVNNSSGFRREDLSASPEPADPRAQFQLNVGHNVFDVASPDARHAVPQRPKTKDDSDPIAQALADLKAGVSKQSSSRMSADRYHGLSTPVQGGPSTSPPNHTHLAKPSHIPDRSSHKNLPPQSHEQRLGAPQPAFTSRAMQQTTQKYVDQNKNMYNVPSRPNARESRHYSQRSDLDHRLGTQRGSGQASSRPVSPVPFRSTSPRPGVHGSPSAQGNLPRAASPNPYLNGIAQAPTNRPRAHSSSPAKSRNDTLGGYPSQAVSVGYQAPQATSPELPGSSSRHERPVSRNGQMEVQLAPSNGYQPQPRYRSSQANGTARPMSQYGQAPGLEQRAGDGQQVGRDGRSILHFSKAMYMYQAAIPEELSFSKGDVLAVLRLQDDGWWEAEVVGKRGRPGLVPSNYLVKC